MKIYIYLICLISAITVSCTQNVKKAEVRDAPEIPDDWLYLDNDEYSIRYPQNWEVHKDFEGTDFCILSLPVSPDDLFRENVNLVIEEIGKEVSIDKYAALSLKNLRKKYDVTDEKKYSVDGQEFYHLILKGKDNIYLKQNYLIKGKKVYILTFAYESDEKEALKHEGDKIMVSFKIK